MRLESSGCSRGAWALALALLSSCSGSSGGPGDLAPVDPQDRNVAFVDRAREAVPVAREVEVLGEFRIVSPKRMDSRFVIAGGEGRHYRYRPLGSDVAVLTYGRKVESGPNVVVLPLDLLGGADVLERVNRVEATCYCPGRTPILAKAIFMDAQKRQLFVSEPERFQRKPALTRLKFTLPEGRKLQGTAFVGIEFTGKGGISSLADIRLSRSAIGAELPSLEAPEPMAFQGEVRRAAALIEGHPWEGEFVVQGRSYLRFSAHAPTLYRGPRGALPELIVDVVAGGETRTRRLKIPSKASGRWHDVKLPLDAGDADDALVRIHAADDREGQGAVILLGEASVMTPVAEPKTVLLITSDTHRADYVGMARRGAGVTTPVLDKLARRGAYFEDCQTTTNTTTASHVSIMTGIHPRETEIVDNVTRVKGEAVTLAESFDAAGYRTFASVSIGHLTPSRSGLGQGFDRFFNPVIMDQRADVGIERLSQWLEDADGEDVFLWLHIFDAHTPYNPPGKKSLVSARNPALELTPQMLGGSEVPTWLEDIEATSLDEIRSWYGGEVEALDTSLSAMLDLPRIQSGWVALTSDHGENLGENRSWFKHSGLFQPVLQVPMVIAGPGVAPLRSAAQVQQIAVGRTLLDLASIDAPFPGRNLFESAEAGELDEPRFALSSYGSQASVTVGKWLLTLGLRTDKKHGDDPFYLAGRVRLFDRTQGMSTEEDFAEREPEITRGLRRRLIQWLESEPEHAPLAESVNVTEAERKELRELGYAGGSEERSTKWWDPARVEDPKWLMDD